MTCQWCIHYRRRGGISLCAEPSGDGSTKPVKEGNKCRKFVPRRNCTTCGRRCSQDEKATKQDEFGSCGEWILRALSTWGGRRAARWRNKGSSGSDSTEKQKKEERT